MNPLIASIQRGCRKLVERKIYFFTVLVVPIFFTFFMMNMMHEGLPLKIPVAMVDQDGSSVSRQVTRQLGASELIDIAYTVNTYAEAMDLMKSGKTFGFYLIPPDFQQKAVGGEGPTLSFYSNMTIFVPGTLSYKGFMATSVVTSGGLVKTTLTGAGISGDIADTLLQPMTVQGHPVGNPWLNYSYYLNNSFVPCMIALMVLLVTAFSITSEIKNGTAPEWLQTAGGSMTVALAGKLLPQLALFSAIGIGMQAVFYRYTWYPLNCSPWHMIFAMLLFVAACQAFAVCIVCVLPNMRLSLSICSLVGILSFSVAGFSFPVEQMYGFIGAFAYVLPVRWYFLIYIDQALNGVPLYYSRWYYIFLLLFLLLPALGLWKLKRHCLRPIYVP